MTRPLITGTTGRRARLVLLALVAFVGAFLWDAGAARAQRVSISADRQIYAGLPFTLAVSAEGFDEEPQPEIVPFEIPGCKVVLRGVSPNVSTSITIINGRRSETRNVEYVYRYEVLAETPGAYQVPAIAVSQGSKRASSQPARFQAGELAATRDMRIELALPDRPVIVGESFEVTIIWYLRKEVHDHNFVVPLFDESSWVDVQQPQLNGLQRRNALKFTAGDRELELPYVRDEVTLDGLEYTRFRFTTSVTPIQAGTLQVQPTRVVASLQVGAGRDAFGFPAARTQLFKAEDVVRTLQIRPLPAQGRPPSFANAVGTAFSIQVQASRTVVKLGEPVELDIVIRGDGRLEGLTLPRLDNPDGLPAGLFSVPDTPPTGEIIDIGEGEKSGNRAKRFRVTVQVESPDVREVPPIAFSYYNPKTGAYETVRSQPIALSVEGSSVVGAQDVVSAVKNAKPDPTEALPASGAGGASVGADLSLSPLASTLERPLRVGDITRFLYLLYGLPLLFLAVRVWQVSTRERRGKSSETRGAVRAVNREIERARSAPARDAGPALLTALRALAATSGQQGIREKDVIARIETESYNPRAGDAPLSAETLAEATKLARELAEKARRSPGQARGAVAVVLPWLIGLGVWAGGSSPARAQAPVQAVQAAAGADNSGTAGVTLEAARSAYQAALAEPERDARAHGFARAERMFRELVQRTPDRPELLADWGNAALGAQDLGRATLAYRRALALDGNLSRAVRNLAWARSRAPSWLPIPASAQAGDSLFFWRHLWSAPVLHLGAAMAFAAAVLLLVPWGWRQRLLRWLAVVPALAWLLLLVPIFTEKPPLGDAVVVTDSVTMLSADSTGAPPAFPHPLPAGAEVTIIETREQWTRVALADGTKGWVPGAAVEHVWQAGP